MRCWRTSTRPHSAPTRRGGARPPGPPWGCRWAVPRFPSREWAEEFCRELNRSETYARSARGWVWPILFIVRGDDGGRRGFVLRLENGRCLGVEWLEEPRGDEAPFVLEAGLRDWLDVVEGRVDPLMAIVRRRIVLARGSYGTVLRFPVAALEMVRAAQRVPRD